MVLVSSERLLGPAVLFHDALFLLGGEVVLNVEILADLRDALALDLGSDLGARKLKQRLDIEVVSGYKQIKE